MRIDEETYLQHFGKKGMKWGVRKAKLAGAGALGAGLGISLVSPRFAKFIGPKMNAPLKVAVAATVTVTSVRLARNLMDEHADMKLSEIS